MCSRYTQTWILLSFLFVGLVNGFKGLPQTRGYAKKTSLAYSPLLDASTILPSLLVKTTAAAARTEFFFFFFAGSGALGIGGAQIPKLLKEYSDIAKLQGQGTSLGGPELEMNPVGSFGLPCKLKEADLRAIIDSAPSAKEILDAGPKRTFMAQQGYIEREGWDKLLPDVDAVTRYAVFDCLTGGGSTNLAQPLAVQESLRKWKADPTLDSFVSDLTVVKSKKLAAYSFFAFLLLLVIDLVVESANNGWFDPSAV